MEYRIYHSIALIALVTLFLSIPLDTALGLYSAALVCGAAAIILAWMYYLSRFKRKSGMSAVITAILANAIFVVNYFYNSGITGPTDIMIAVTVLLTIAITPYKQHRMWLAVNIVLLIALHTIDFLNPGLAPYQYHSRLDLFFDKTFTLIIGAVLIYYTIKYIRHNYDHERQQAEEKAAAIIEQNEQLEYLNAEKSKLMSIIAHDLRAPLSNIHNHLQLVTEFGLDKHEREMVEADLLKATDNTLTMLSKLLVWSRSQMDGVTVKLSDMNLLDALRNTLEMEMMLATKKDITLTYHIDPKITVIADTDMLQLVVRNLTSNAIKFTPPGGRVQVNARIEMNECRISVRDNGQGIPYEQQRDIFTLKARSTFGTRKEKGVGLGLVLCKEFVEQQGGRIGYDSTPGQGSIFYVYMPVG
ncbi:MAG: HAMP domain-containing histidine kinase [Bacteroidetes bacterium]|nr:HAMP domain-containing histidine kinase [Bacteroidota bacterium]